jgi:hypothetical protein
MRKSALVIAALLTAVVTPLPASAAPPRTVTVTESQNGRSVTVHKGQHIQVVLHSTYWTIGQAHGKALATTSRQTTKGPGSPCRPPGSGCGTVSRTFLAAGAGTGSLTASRTTCGEVLRCTGTRGQYKVSVSVVS